VNAMLMNPATRTCCPSQQIPYVMNFCLTDKQTTAISPFYCGFDTHAVGDVFTLYISVLFSSNAQFNTTVGTSGSDNTSVARDGGSTVTDVGGGQSNISATSSGSFYTNSACDQGSLAAAALLAVLKVTFQKSDGSALPDPFRVGISAAQLDGTTHDRTQHLRALVEPHAEAANVNIVGVGVAVSN